SFASTAVVIGLRANATAMLVPRSTVRVFCAHIASSGNGSCFISGIHTPRYPAASAFFAAVRASTSFGATRSTSMALLDRGQCYRRAASTAAQSDSNCRQILWGNHVDPLAPCPIIELSVDFASYRERDAQDVISRSRIHLSPGRAL